MPRPLRLLPTACLTLALAASAALAASGIFDRANAETFTIKGQTTTLTAEVITDFDEPWAMTFLPSGEMLVTTKP
ncbi:MAG: hypothetical protein AAFR55_05940, partial [Pseudomonadota bacterium]